MNIGSCRLSNGSCRLLDAASLFRVPLKCRVCSYDAEPSDLLICQGCGRGGIYHKSCWDDWDDHKPSAGPTVWEPCEKVEMSDFLWISWLFNSNINRQEQKSLHRKDIWATWFGVPYYQREPLLYVYPRLQTLVGSSHSSSSPSVQHPSIVSFFGDTGGGKSALIRALIRNSGPEGLLTEAPVPGNQADLEKSTSGDVHMYADPSSLTSETPVFYVGEYRLQFWVQISDITIRL